MPRDYRLYLDDILTSIDRVRYYVQGIDFDSFSHDSMRVDVVVRNLEVMG
jgi:uncharacterized protein with HEPN domain